MVNRYPLWKYLLIAVLLAVGTLYAVPNLYPPDPAVQLSASRADALEPGVEERVRIVLQERGLDPKRIENDGQQLLVRFSDTESQLEAADVIRATLGSGYVVALNLAAGTPEWLRALNAAPMNLGLDLRGGVHFLMEVDVEAALGKSLERYEGEFRSSLRDENLRYQTVRRTGETVLAEFTDRETRDAASDLLRDTYRGELAFDEREEGSLFIVEGRITEEAEREQKRLALQQNIITLRKRVNELGVAEPMIQQQGENRVVVQLPGVQDTTRAKEILGATATLEFRLVDEQNDPYLARESGRIPAGSRLYSERNGEPILLKRRVMLTGDYIVDASSGIAQDTGGAAVFVNLDGKGARLFAKVTGDNVKRLMAVVFIETKSETVLVDGEPVLRSRQVEEVINVARIQEQLSRRFQITGLDSTREARDLALLLRAGALAAPMRIVEERTVGPSLGRDNIEQGRMSVIIGFVLTVVFMTLYYRVFGLIANVALFVNVVLIVALLSLIQATLTLPGIAGIVLTVGMAVDANVLIFERIREELRAGVSPQAAISSGYDKAFSTIADANITTLIAAVVLFGLGSGPVKGFAVTLSLGIICSMFTAIMLTRALVNLLYGGRRLKSLPI
jgi:preprotein translocase subunit SecD